MNQMSICKLFYTYKNHFTDYEPHIKFLFKKTFNVYYSNKKFKYYFIDTFDKC